MEKIKVLVKDPGLPARFLTIPNDLKTLQGIVDGYIEIVTVDDICVICNEEGCAECSRTSHTEAMTLWARSS